MGYRNELWEWAALTQAMGMGRGNGLREGMGCGMGCRELQWAAGLGCKNALTGIR